MFRLTYFGYAFTRGWALGSWIWLLDVYQRAEEAPAMADDDVATMAYSDDDASTAALEAYFDGLDGFESDDDASTIAYDNASDSTGYATTISISETDDDVENDPASP